MKRADQQITQEDQQLKSGKRKSSSTSYQPLQKKANQGLEAIEERRKLREAKTKKLLPRSDTIVEGGLNTIVQFYRIKTTK